MKYTVAVQRISYAYADVVVEADSEEEAMDLAWDTVTEDEAIRFREDTSNDEYRCLEAKELEEAVDE